MASMALMGRRGCSCDSCRSRKIRCDRGFPCSNCKASKLTPSYEKKIDRIEDRLAGIETVLEKLATKLADLSIQKESESGSHSRSSRIARSPNSSTEHHSGTPAPFEGETTLNSQSAFAREFLEQAVGSTPSIGQNEEVKAALASLQDIVSRQGQNASTSNEPQPFFNKALADIDSSKLERPPWEAVVEVIEKASTHPTMCFAMVFPFLNLRTMQETFKKTFESPDDCPTVRRILVYGVLYNLFMEFSCYPLVGRRIEPFQKYSKQCRVQLEVAVSQLELFVPASYENILGMVLAASYAVELCKPSLCWALNSKAVAMCQDLGYHRISTMKGDSKDERAAKIHVFWFVYIMDKTLSLRLGRASAIQDWDMSLPFPTSSDAGYHNGSLRMGNDFLLYWIKLGQVQGSTYEKLFSPAAFNKSAEERAQIASELVNALNLAWVERGDASVLNFSFPHVKVSGTKQALTPNETELPSQRQRAPYFYPTQTQISLGSESRPTLYSEGFLGEDVADLFYYGDVVMHYSTASLIQRAVSSDNVTFNQDCLDSARAALIAHQRASEQFNVKGKEDLWSGYLHWSVLQAPFTPFIVIFSNAISKCDDADLSQLSDFVSSLESCRTVSEGADKLYKMCHLFLQVAKLYIEAKRKELSQHLRGSPQGDYYQTANGATQNLDFSTMTQFDPYLSALGLTNSAWSMSASFPQNHPGIEVFQGMEAGNMGGNQNTVQDWFSGSRYIMGLMEDDINMPDLS
ncbi:fungal-specific transcription factor domain-containing protein [Lojkania enalia]|uniref:Fungal-specific transcription factor domain-containing protein n=1 Tax=Lojkania enalia TaxID=147567 RepID=A0A9P4JXB1_9PLEO|nr:fungal-specific transcription factor domain-containing protein [Didymosphaeria enalia]